MLSLLLSLALAFLTLSQSADAQDANFEEPVFAMVSVSFPTNSSVFRPSPEQAALLADVDRAAMITVNGRTSTNTPSVRDELLAHERAVAARAWLVARGVSPLKIMINYASAADFKADNSTPEGRYQNQRVDIEIYYVPWAY
jgi:outer membrane protein OmpA-like peptidoglycan-associated protein